MSWPAPALGAVAIVFSTIAASPALATTTQSIAHVQGTSASTPLEGQTVTVQGVVTAVLPSFGGFFLQSQSSAGVTGASDGIFVRDADTEFASGDLVTVSGTAGEVNDETQIAATSVDLVEAAVGLPAATSLPDRVVGAAREAYEGMLVTPTGNYVLDSVADQTGELVVSAGNEPTDAATRLSIDDGYDIPVSTQPFLQSDTVIEPGDALVAPREPLVLGQGADGYRLEPLVPLTAATDLAYKPKFDVATPRLGDAPVLTP